MAWDAAAAACAQAIRARPRGTRWFLACDQDADGLCAAAVAAAALAKCGHRFTVRASRDKDAVHYEAMFRDEWDGLILLDKGSGNVRRLAELARASNRPVILVDHHVLPPGPLPEGIHVLNPRAEGMDGSRDASAATTALALAYALVGPDAAKWTATALAGAVGDWQHRGGWHGWNKEALERARKSGHLQTRPLPRFIGLPLTEAVARAHPSVPGLAGDRAAASALVRGAGVPEHAEMEDLDDDQATALLSALTLHLVAIGEGPAAESLVVPLDVDAAGMTLRRRFRIVDACAREGRPDVGVAWLLGDTSAKPDAMACFAAYREAIQEGLDVLAQDGLKPMGALQWGRTHRPAYTGMVAGIAMTHLVSDLARPIVLAADRPDGRLQVSTRGTLEQCAAGMDLAGTVAAAAAAVDAEGGGHPNAAGAVIPAAALERFLGVLDEGLMRQGFVAKL